MQIEPHTKIVQPDFGSQPRLKAGQVVRTLTRQAKGIQEFVVDGLDDLSKARQPTSQGFGPVDALTTLVRWRHQIDLSLGLPTAAWSFSGKAFVCHIGALSRQATASQLWRRCVTSSKQGGCQVLLMRACASKAKAGNYSLSRDAQQEMEAFGPANAITPADICLSSQPAGAAPFGIACDCGGAIEDFEATALGLQQQDQKQGESRDRIPVGSLQPIELAAMRQLRKRFWQVMLSISVKRSFDFRNCTHCPNSANVITSLRLNDASGPGLGFSDSSSDWQKSSTITYSVGKSVSRSIISELLFSRIGLLSSLYGLDLFFFKSFPFHTKRLSTHVLERISQVASTGMFYSSRRAYF
jgi:hypothetical protein